MQDDIVQELGDSLRSEAEEHEQATGHPLTADEQAAMLKKRGHPWLMASRYLPQQQLIGPALFPYYRQALKIVVFWVVLPITLDRRRAQRDLLRRIRRRSGGACSARRGTAPSIPSASSPSSSPILDRGKLRVTVLDNWNPARTCRNRQRRPRDSAIGDGDRPGVRADVPGLVDDLVRVPEFTFFDGDPVRFVPAPIWQELYFPILVSLVASIGVYFDRSRAAVAHAHRVGG